MHPLLAGHHPDEGVVGLHLLPGGRMRVYRRDPAGIRSEDLPFYPFLFISDPAYVRGLTSKHWIKELAGDHHFGHIVVFERWSELWDAVRLMMDRYNSSALVRAGNFSELPILYLRHDAQTQFLLQTGRTLFEGLSFDSIHRLQLDIETTTRHGAPYSNPERIDDRIVVAALSDNRGWSHVLDGRSLREDELLTELCRIVRELDPDVIEGHNILNFDLPYLLKRCELHGVPPLLGRDGGAVRPGDSLHALLERSGEFQTYDIPGRHVIDTYMLLQHYDAQKRALDNYGLKSAARHFGFAKSDRIYVRGDRIPWYWEHEPDLLVRYAMDDAEETRNLSDILSPPHIAMTRILPFPYGAVPRLGATARAESLMLREYLHRKHSFPLSAAHTPSAAAHGEPVVTGVLGPIVHISIDSLSPALLVRDSERPAADTLNVYGELLTSLFELVEDTSIEDADTHHAAGRILLSALFSSLGQGRFSFSDAALADRTLAAGEALMESFSGLLRQRGAIIVESEPEGMYLVPSPDIRTEAAEQQFVAAAVKGFPPGARVSVDGRFKRMLAYRRRNFALLTYDDRVKIRGSALLSRSLERYLRQYVTTCIDALLHNKIASLHGIYATLARDITEQRLTIEDVVRTETFRDTLETYDREIEEGTRRRHAAYELARQQAMPVRPGERISYYFIGTEEHVKGHEHCRLASEWDPNFSDINGAYYLRRLNEISERFSAFFTPQDFSAIFSMEGLFAFSPDGIRILTTETPAPPAPAGDETDESGAPPLRIWLAPS